MLIIDLDNNRICGSATAKQIKQYGLIEASKKNK